MTDGPPDAGKKRGVFFPNLDALRFFAFLSVFLSHSFHSEQRAVLDDPLYQAILMVKSAGAMGVNFFFVLSGFLITYLLLEENELRGRIDVPAFYVRRALRIWPLYYVVVAFGFFVYPILKAGAGRAGTESAHLLAYLCFGGNFDIIFNGRMPDSSLLGVLWSLAVEEQFYLCWPLAMRVVPTRHLPKLFAAMLVGTMVYRHVSYTDSYRLDFGTFSVISDMVVGAALAYYGRGEAPWLMRLRHIGRPAIAAVYLLGLPAVYVLFRIQATGPWIATFSRLLIGLFFAFVIFEQNDAERSFVKLGRSRLLGELGKITYGLYCLHFVGILVVLNVNRKVFHLNTSVWQVLLLETAAALVVTIVVSAVSYRWFEKPFLRFKDRFSRTEPRP